MKRYLGILAVILMISCSPDQKLVKENEELKQLTKELTQAVNEQKQRAEEAEAKTLAAVSEVQRQAEITMEVATRATAEAERQAEMVRWAQMMIGESAGEVLQVRVEVENLKKQLENCN